MFVQFYVMRDLEKMAGPIRIAVIYLVSGMAGNLASCCFVPYGANVSARKQFSAGGGEVESSSENLRM